MMQFCKEFNEKTNYFRNDIPLRVLLKAYNDRTYEYKIKPPPTSWFIKRLGQAYMGVGRPHLEYHGMISIKHVYELAKVKQEFDEDLKTHSIHGIMRSILGQMDTMGFYPVKDTPGPLLPVTPKKF